MTNKNDWVMPDDARIRKVILDAMGCYVEYLYVMSASSMAGGCKCADCRGTKHSVRSMNHILGDAQGIRDAFERGMFKVVENVTDAGDSA